MLIKNLTAILLLIFLATACDDSQLPDPGPITDPIDNGDDNTPDPDPTPTPDPDPTPTPDPDPKPTPDPDPTPTPDPDPTPTPDPDPVPTPDPDPVPTPDPDPIPTPDPDPVPTPDPDPSPTTSVYTPKGVGGGGAMSGVAISPYSNTWFVGTDMGTLFRSDDRGRNWVPVNHFEAVFNSHLPHAVSPGFASDGKTIFHASAGLNPSRSLDGGKTFTKMNMGLNNNERVIYWKEDHKDANIIFAGTNTGLLISKNKGASWSRTAAPSAEAKGTFIDHNGSTTTVYHATGDKIVKSTNYGSSFTNLHNPSHVIRMFTGARDSNGVTLAYGDDNGSSACVWANAWLAEWGQNSINETYANCGYVWVKKNNNSFVNTKQAVGDHLKMAVNDSKTIYTTGAKAWIRQYGTQVHISHNSGSSWDLVLNQMDYDNRYSPWPMNKIEYSAVAVDVGWWDNGYESFTINNLNSSEVMGSGWFFLHASTNKGQYWQAPFTEFKDSGDPVAGKKWATQGVNVISVYRLKTHPKNPKLMYAANADVGGYVSEDNGETFRICKAQYNSNYDYAFDSNNQNVVFAASGNSHDWPLGWHANAIVNAGGIYKSTNKGRSWTQLTPSGSFNRQFLSVGYDDQRNIVYGGSHGAGIGRSVNGGAWTWFNNGLPSGDKIIPQITVDPANGNVYALVTGNAPSFTNNTKTGIYLLDIANGATSWRLLRGNVEYPQDALQGYGLWYYPTSFTVDFSDPSRRTLWLTDYENNRNWLMTGVWKSEDGGQNWERKVQMTHATGVSIDPSNPDYIFASGMYQLDGNWGNGGQFFSKDGGETWKKNMTPTLQQNSRHVLVDQTNPNNVFYTYFGGGILKGPNPARKPAGLDLQTVR